MQKNQGVIMNARGKMQVHTKQRLRDDKVKLIAENKELKWQIEQLNKQLDSYNKAKNKARSQKEK